jgi:hypothetical protein
MYELIHTKNDLEYSATDAEESNKVYCTIIVTDGGSEFDNPWFVVSQGAPSDDIVHHSA